jgi:hypothetical protein
MHSTDMDVAVLAAEVLFNVCVPANSMLYSLNDDHGDVYEVKRRRFLY